MEKKQFNLADYETGKYDVVTRDGRKVRVLATDLDYGDGLVKIGLHTEKQGMWSCFEDGSYRSGAGFDQKHVLDLFLTEKEVLTESYGNYYEDHQISYWHDTLEQANFEAINNRRVAVIKLTKSNLRGVIAVEIVKEGE